MYIMANIHCDNGVAEIFLTGYFNSGFLRKGQVAGLYRVNNVYLCIVGSTAYKEEHRRIKMGKLQLHYDKALKLVNGNGQLHKF